YERSAGPAPRRRHATLATRPAPRSGRGHRSPTKPGSRPCRDRSRPPASPPEAPPEADSTRATSLRRTKKEDNDAPRTGTPIRSAQCLSAGGELGLDRGRELFGLEAERAFASLEGAAAVAPD